jgi:hypothetical protein
MRSPHRRLVTILPALLACAVLAGSPGRANAEEPVAAPEAIAKPQEARNAPAGPMGPLGPLSPEAAAKPRTDPNKAAPGVRTAPKAAARPAGVRTLSEVPIHGELGVTQILFITGRDQHRYFDFLIARYLQDASVLAADLVLPRSVGPAGIPAALAAPGSAQEPRTGSEGQ